MVKIIVGGGGGGVVIVVVVVVIVVVVLCFILICINELLFMNVRVENSCMHGHCVAKAGDDSNRFLVVI